MCGWTRSVRVSVAVVAWSVTGVAAEGEEIAANARLAHLLERRAVSQAIRGATRRLGKARCQGLLEEFADAAGQPLRVTLEGQGVDVGRYLERVLFYDAPEAACGRGMIAGTSAGSRVIRVCGREFVRAMADSTLYAENVIIHEMLHSLGLDENPPTSSYITSRVMERCGR
jgi:hypothetical protein